MGTKVTKKYFKRLKDIREDKTLTPMEVFMLQTLATVEENNLNFETAYRDIKKKKQTV